MNYLIRVSTVFLVVCSLILAQSNSLLAQSQAPSSSPEVKTDVTKNTPSDATVPHIALNLPPASPTSGMPTPLPAPAPAPAPAKAADSGGSSQHLALIAGLAM